MDRRPRIAPQRGQRVTPRADLDDVVYGIHAVTEALVAHEPIRKIHVGDERKNDPALRNLLELARRNDVPIRFESRAFFANFPYKAHQSVVAYGAPFDYVTLDEAIAARRGQALFVVLDHVTDPHNVGAIIRTTEAAGGTALIVPERRAAGVNATVRKSAAGAAAHLPVARVANVAQSIRSLKKAGVWIVGAALGEGSVPHTAIDFDRDIALVIGAEDGLSQLVRRECDFLAAIPMLGKTESLNASVATAVLLYEAVRQRSTGSA